MIPLHDDNPTRIFPYVTVGVILACTLAFLWQASLGQQANRAIAYSLGLIPAVITHRLQLPGELALVAPSLTIVTSMFLHGGFLHLAGNMLYLWIFGNNVEDAMGHGRFLVFYLVCGSAAALGQVLQDPASQIPMIGASGAISGVLGAYLLLYPHARVLVLLPLGFFVYMVRIPAGWVLGLWFALQLLSSVLISEQGGGGVAWFAHIGGFIAGLILIPVFKRRGVKLFQPPRRPDIYSEE
jgi:membrane associated rhomboid family serine protease